MLLSEYGVEPVVVPDRAFRAVLDEVARDAADDPLLAPVREERPTAVLLGQYLAAINILSADEEEDLHVRMLAGAVRAGHRSLVFKPHPTAPAGYAAALHKAAADAGVRLTVQDAPLLAETLYEHARPELVVGCFSTAMVTASAYYGVPVARVGTALVLDRLRPYQNSNRIPLALVDHLVPDLERDETPAVLGLRRRRWGRWCGRWGSACSRGRIPRCGGGGGVAAGASRGQPRRVLSGLAAGRVGVAGQQRGDPARCGLRGPGGRWEGWCGGAGAVGTTSAAGRWGFSRGSPRPCKGSAGSPPRGAGNCANGEVRRVSSQPARSPWAGSGPTPSGARGTARTAGPDASPPQRARAPLTSPRTASRSP